MGEESTPEQNKAVVRRWIELWNTKRADGVDEVFAPHFRDPQLEQRLAQPRTLETFKESPRALQGAIGQARFKEREILADGDRVIVRWTMRATHQAPFWGLPPTGSPFALDGVNIFRVEDEPVVERLSYVDAASLLAQPDPTASAKAAEGDR
jgi:steroid delta-isomerase-like uncharacterized protein